MSKNVQGIGTLGWSFADLNDVPSVLGDIIGLDKAEYLLRSFSQIATDKDLAMRLLVDENGLEREMMRAARAFFSGPQEPASSDKVYELHMVLAFEGCLQSDGSSDPETEALSFEGGRLSPGGICGGKRADGSYQHFLSPRLSKMPSFLWAALCALSTRAEIESVICLYRSRRYPLDLIVNSKGSPPDPAEYLEEIADDLGIKGALARLVTDKSFNCDLKPHRIRKLEAELNISYEEAAPLKSE